MAGQGKSPKKTNIFYNYCTASAEEWRVPSDAGGTTSEEFLSA